MKKTILIIFVFILSLSLTSFAQEFNKTINFQCKIDNGSLLKVYSQGKWVSNYCKAELDGEEIIAEFVYRRGSNIANAYAISLYKDITLYQFEKNPKLILDLIEKQIAIGVFEDNRIKFIFSSISESSNKLEVSGACENIQ